MENASKALIMAGGILIGILVLALMFTLFVTSNSLFSTYEATKNAEAIQQFNVNFTQFIGRELTLHEVITIANFANKSNVNISQEGAFSLDVTQISKDIEEEVNAVEEKVKVIYNMEITNYTNGYVSNIKFRIVALCDTKIIQIH